VLHSLSPAFARGSISLLLRAAAGSKFEVLIGDRAERCGSNQVSVFCQYAAGITRFGRRPRPEPFFELGGRNLKIKPALVRVDGDRIAIPDEGEGAADIRLGRDVANHKTV